MPENEGLDMQQSINATDGTCMRTRAGNMQQSINARNGTCMRTRDGTCNNQSCTRTRDGTCNNQLTPMETTRAKTKAERG